MTMSNKKNISPKIKEIINIVVIILWLVIIFLFSAQNGTESESVSSEVIIKTVETITREELTTSEKENLVKKVLFPVRKSAHFFLYFVLAIIVFTFCLKKFKMTRKSFIITILFCFLYSITDEIHQLFVVGRTSRILDIFIDTIGATISTLIYYGIYQIIKKKRLSSKK